MKTTDAARTLAGIKFTWSLNRYHPLSTSTPKIIRFLNKNFDPVNGALMTWGVVRTAWVAQGRVVAVLHTTHLGGDLVVYTDVEFAAALAAGDTSFFMLAQVVEVGAEKVEAVEVAPLVELWSRVKFELEATRLCDVTGSQVEQIAAVRRLAFDVVGEDEWTLSDGEVEPWLNVAGFLTDTPNQRENDEADVPALQRLWATCTAFLMLAQE